MNVNETQAIYDFAQKTRNGVMVWQKKPLPFDQYTNSVITERYTTEHNDEAMELYVESRVDTESDVDYHRSTIHLWILDEKGDHLWRFPENDALADLLSNVRFQTGKVGDRLKRLLKG